MSSLPAAALDTLAYARVFAKHVEELAELTARAPDRDRRPAAAARG